MNDSKVANDKNIKAIEKISDELEQVYKELELVQKENYLFELYLTRVTDRKTDKMPEPVVQEDNFIALTLEEKYEIAMEEESNLKAQINSGKEEAESTIESLKAVIEEIDVTIKEIRKEAMEFQKEMLENPEHTTSGKIDAAKVIRFREAQMLEKQAKIEKLAIKKTTLESKLMKIETALKKKEVTGDELKFIDFHQLQIENKKYLKDLEDKNAKLLELKLQVRSADRRDRRSAQQIQAGTRQTARLQGKIHPGHTAQTRTAGKRR